MDAKENAIITVQTTINAPMDMVWKKWTSPESIVKWNNASDDWHTTRAENDLRIGGKFLSRMEAKDGSFGFDFEGEYTNIKEFESIEYQLADDRKVNISFSNTSNSVIILESFEAESTNTIDLQKAGWQAILDNFKKYVEQT